MHKEDSRKQLLDYLSIFLDKVSTKGECNLTTVVETPWSKVMKADTEQGCYYMKQTPKDLFIETEIIEGIRRNIFNASVPEIVAENGRLHCFIMKSCGDYSLRAKFQGLLDSELLVKGLEVYIKIQRTLEENINDFLKRNVPNWSINNIPDLYIDLLEEKDILIEEGFVPGEIDQLMKLIPQVKETCKLLFKSKVKETLVNCDLNENNIIVDENIQKLFIVDWGESVISHPFFTLASHMKSIARRYQLDLNGLLLNTIKNKYLSYWLDVATESELKEIYGNILKISPIFSSLALSRLQNATNNKSKTVQNWFIKDNLGLLLDEGWFK